MSQARRAFALHGFLAGVACLVSTLAAQEIAPVDYEAEIQPLLTRSCGGGTCHIGRRQSGVELTNYDSVIASRGSFYRSLVVLAGDAVGSPLFDKVSSSRPRFGSRMPFGRPALPEEEVELIRRWIDEGATREPASPPDLPLRGDPDGSDQINISDAIFVLNFLFLGGPAPNCPPTADTNADGSVNLSDAVFLLSFLFLGGSNPPDMTIDEAGTCEMVVAI